MATAAKRVQPINRLPREYEYPGLSFNESLDLFLNSRLTATHGARGQARPNTIKMYRRDIELMFVWMKSKYSIEFYNQVKRQHMRSYVADVQSRETWKPTTRSRHWRSIRAFFNWVDRDEVCHDERMVSWVKELPAILKAKKKDHIPDLADIKAFFDALDTGTRSGLRDKAIFALFMSTGMRCGEVEKLKLGNLFLSEGMITTPPDGKTGKRPVYIKSSVTGLLQKWLVVRNKFAQGHDFVFCTDEGKQLAENFMSHRFKQLRIKLGLGSTAKGNITPHMLRHAFGTYYLLNGGALQHLKEIMGHTSYQTTDIYLQLANKPQVRRDHEKYDPFETMMKEKKHK